MRKLQKSHVVVALLAVASVVSLFGATLTSVIASPANWVDIFSTKPVEANVFFKEAPGQMPWALPPTWTWKSSGLYSSWGRTNLHIVLLAGDMEAGDEIDFRVYARLYNAGKSQHVNVVIYETTIYHTDIDRDVVIWVPLGKFYFSVLGPSDTIISMSFYLSGS